MLGPGGSVELCGFGTGGDTSKLGRLEDGCGESCEIEFVSQSEAASPWL